MNQPRTKLSELLELMKAEDWVSAVKFASQSSDLGTHKAAIRRASAALLSPQFYRELGQSPEALLSEGIKALQQRYQQRPPAPRRTA